MQQNIIIDTDPGVDDALAIYYSLSKFSDNLAGICSVFGNANVEQTTQNCLDLLQLFDSNISVYKGESQPICGEGILANSHGDNGLGNIILNKSKNQIKGNAVDFYIDYLSQNKATILILGPSTNLATAINIKPEIKKNIQKVVILGGSFDQKGNQNEFAEFNVLNDPNSLDILLKSNCNISLMPINVCRKIIFGQTELSQLPQKLSQFCQYYYQYYTQNPKYEKRLGAVMYDLLVPIFLTKPELFTYKEMKVLLNIDPKSKEYGRTLESTEGELVQLITDVKAQELTKEFFSLFL
jgi:purine nucleosidase